MDVTSPPDDVASAAAALSAFSSAWQSNVACTSVIEPRDCAARCAPVGVAVEGGALRSSGALERHPGSNRASLLVVVIAPASDASTMASISEAHSSRSAVAMLACAGVGWGNVLEVPPPRPPADLTPDFPPGLPPAAGGGTDRAAFSESRIRCRACRWE